MMLRLCRTHAIVAIRTAGLIRLPLFGKIQKHRNGCVAIVGVVVVCAALERRLIADIICWRLEAVHMQGQQDDENDNDWNHVAEIRNAR